MRRKLVNPSKKFRAQLILHLYLSSRHAFLFVRVGLEGRVLYLGHVNSFAFECSICHQVIVRGDDVLEIQEGESLALGCADVYWLILAPVTLCLHMWW